MRLDDFVLLRFLFQVGVMRQLNPTKTSLSDDLHKNLMISIPGSSSPLKGLQERNIDEPGEMDKKTHHPTPDNI